MYPGKISNQNTFRLSVLGDLTEKDIEYFLAEISDVLNKININLREK